MRRVIEFLREIDRYKTAGGRAAAGIDIDRTGRVSAADRAGTAPAQRAAVRLGWITAGGINVPANHDITSYLQRLDIHLGGR